MTSKKDILNVAIVGGGSGCKAIMDMIFAKKLSQLKMKLIGVACTNPKAVGYLYALEMGIFTTEDYHDLFKLKDLDMIIELTNREQIANEIFRTKPDHVRLMGHVAARLFWDVFQIEEERIAERREAEHQVNLQKMFSEFLIQQGTDAIVVLNTDFTVAEANDVYLKSVKKSKEEVVGSYCYKISHGLDVPCSSSHPELGCPVVETLRTGKSSHVLHEHPTSAGEPIYCDIISYPLVGHDGKIEKVIEIWRDITEAFSTRWDARVNEIKSDLNKLVQEDRMISLGKLVASCVHEINNPIHGLLTFSLLMEEILAEGDPSPEDIKKFKQHLSIMSKELERCGKIVSGLLSFSRESSMSHSNVDLNEMLNAVITLTQHKMRLQNIKLIAKLTPEFTVVKGDGSQLQQCFLNLIFNAIEAMPRGGELSIVSEMDRAKKNLQIEIIDTGFGILKENMDNIFDPFFTTKEEGQGTGLGLSIVYGVVKNHQGDVKVISEKGKGSSFVLNFPTTT